MSALRKAPTAALLAELRRRARQGDPEAQEWCREAGPDGRPDPAAILRAWEAARDGRHPFLTLGRA